MKKLIALSALVLLASCQTADMEETDTTSTGGVEMKVEEITDTTVETEVKVEETSTGSAE